MKTKQSDQSHLMIDIEALGPAPDGCIVSIGWCTFDPWKMTNIKRGHKISGSMLVDLHSCADVGLKVDVNTIQWWSRQSDRVRRQLDDGPRFTLRHCLEELNSVYSLSCSLGALVWAYPATYDLTILETAFQKTGLEPAWGRNKISCARSVSKLLGCHTDPKELDTDLLEEHMPEMDAIRQATMLQLCLRKMKNSLSAAT